MTAAGRPCTCPRRAGVALDLGLDLGELVADQLAELLREVLGQPAAQLDVLADLVATRRFDLAPVEDLERQVAPDRLRFDQVLDRLGADTPRR